MSEQLTALNNQALATGGIGLGAAIFKGKIQYLEIVQKTTRQEGAIPGKFRNTSTGEHFSEMRIVLLDVPREHREYYEGTEFSKDSKQCFSLDNVQPHARAKNPPALYCASCPMGDLRWKRWRETKDPKDLPKCQMFYHLLLADRETQTPFFMNVKGISVMPFKAAMENQMYGLLQKMVADVKAKNKQRGYTLDNKTGQFVTIPGFIQEATEDSPEKVKRQKPLSMPNIFDISFVIYITSREKGGPPVIGCKDFKAMQDADRAEFGALYLEYAQRKSEPEDPSIAEEAQAAAVVAESEPSVVLPRTAVGTVIAKDAPIEI